MVEFKVEDLPKAVGIQWSRVKNEREVDIEKKVTVTEENEHEDEAWGAWNSSWSSEIKKSSRLLRNYSSSLLRIQESINETESTVGRERIRFVLNSIIDIWASSSGFDDDWAWACALFQNCSSPLLCNGLK